MEEAGFILRQSGARIFIVARNWRNRDCAGLLGSLDASPALAHVVVIGDELPGTVAWDEVENDATVSFSPPAADPDDPCLLVYTSGITADPKGLAGVRRHFAGAGLARQKTPEKLVITDALPRTAAVKVRKFALRASLR